MRWMTWRATPARFYLLDLDAHGLGDLVNVGAGLVDGIVVRRAHPVHAAGSLITSTRVDIELDLPSRWDIHCAEH